MESEWDVGDGIHGPRHSEQKQICSGNMQCESGHGGSAVDREHLASGQRLSSTTLGSGLHLVKHNEPLEAFKKGSNAEDVLVDLRGQGDCWEAVALLYLTEMRK